MFKKRTLAIWIVIAAGSAFVARSRVEPHL